MTRFAGRPIVFMSLTLLAACGDISQVATPTEPTFEPQFGSVSQGASNVDIVARGHMSGVFESSFWSGTMSFSLAVRGESNVFGGAHGGFLFASDPDLPLFGQRTVSGNVRCVVGSERLAADGETRKRLVITVDPKNVPNHIAGGGALVFVLLDRDGEVTFGAPGFAAPNECGTSVSSMGELVTTQGHLEVEVPPSDVAVLTPNYGPAGGPFTISDAGARFQTGDIVYFYPQSGDPTAGVPADNVVVSGDGRFVYGNAPATLVPGVHYSVAVAVAVGDPSRVFIPWYLVAN